ncbi:MAG: V-type ATP synthase subunit I, partial [Bacteroidota bacterium]
EKYRSSLESEISLMNTYHETVKATGDRLRILEGWVPADKEKEVKELIDEEKVVAVEANPEINEAPPVQLKNSSFSRLFEPISNLFDLPSYRELDLTPYFAPFFMLFFGFCLGDAGYGVFFILFGGLMKLKARKEFKPILSLTQYLGVATILFGLVSGTFFGINLIDSGYTLTSGSIQELNRSEVPNEVVMQLSDMEGNYYKSRSEFLEAVGTEVGTETAEEYEMQIMKEAEAGIPIVGKFRHLMQDSLSLFYLSMLLGGLQIIFGMIIRIFNISRRRGFNYALPTLGWVILILSVILYYTGIFEGTVMTFVFYGLLVIAGVFIFLLNNAGKNIFIRIGSGIWDSYGTVTGLFGDLLSYIRLFALGISSAILGFVFNDISLQLLDIPYIGWLLFLVLLLFGHSINLFMATLGGFIHPMRLTFVEFYKNAGFTGGGKKYKPFIINN